MPHSPITRRRFVTSAGALGAVAIVSPQAALGGTTSAPTLRGRFTEGVLSGDPEPTEITVWTRIAEPEAVAARAGSPPVGTVALEVARDRGFRDVVARKLIRTHGRVGHAAKARIKNLAPHQQYYYRFSTADNDSPVGRFRTALPGDSRETVRFAFFSCQEYTWGYYNAHALLAREDVDFVVNLGDYVYHDLKFPAPAVGVRPVDDQPQVLDELDQFRRRYSAYRADPNLQRMHANHAMISTWDDHEVVNDYAGADEEGGGSATDSQWSVRKRDEAYRAFFEAMPTYVVDRSRLFHRASFGRTVDLFVLDERQYRDAQPTCRTDQECPELDDPRAFLGSSQLEFAQSGLTSSRAAWKVIANEVPIMELRNEEDNAQTYDIWQGYPREREALLRTIRDRVDDVVFITGDYHAFIAGDVQTADGTVVATEFVGGSITSASTEELFALTQVRPGFGTPDEPRVPDSYQRAHERNNPWVSDLDYIRHGYCVCEASRSSFTATFKKLDTVRRRSTRLSEQRSFTLTRGRARVTDPTET